MTGRRPFGPDELDGVAGLTPDELAAETRLARDLEGIAARDGIRPSPGFYSRGGTVNARGAVRLLVQRKAGSRWRTSRSRSSSCRSPRIVTRNVTRDTQGLQPAAAGRSLKTADTPHVARCFASPSRARSFGTFETVRDVTRQSRARAPEHRALGR